MTWNNYLTNAGYLIIGVFVLARSAFEGLVLIVNTIF